MYYRRNERLYVMATHRNLRDTQKLQINPRKASISAIARAALAAVFLHLCGDIILRLCNFFESGFAEAPRFPAEARWARPKIASCGPERVCRREIAAASIVEEAVQLLITIQDCVPLQIWETDCRRCLLVTVS